MRLKGFALGLAFALATFLDFSPNVPPAFAQADQCINPPAGVSIRRTRYLNCPAQTGAGYAIDALRANGSLTGDVLTVQADGSIAAATPTGGSGSAISFTDETTELTTALTGLTFTGDGVTCTEPNADEVSCAVPAGGASTFTGLTDTPSAITASECLQANAAGDALVSVDCATLGGGGTDDQTAAEVSFDATGLTGTLAALPDSSNVAAALTAIDGFTLGGRWRRLPAFWRAARSSAR